MKKNKSLFFIALTIVIIAVSIYILKNMSLVWTEINDETALVTINFLLPMDEEALNECISIQPQIPDASNFECEVNWLSTNVVQLRLTEKSPIKGQKIQLFIDEAPTKYSFIKRNVKLAIQFKTPIEILSPSKEILVSTQNPFIIQFNTPMRRSLLNKYLQSDAAFYIEAVQKTLPNGQVISDSTAYEFKPKVALENGRKYLLSFRKGMPSQSGIMLKEDKSITLATDIKPIITTLYPENGSKWVGLFPRIILETDLPITQSSIILDGQTLIGKNLTDYKAVFYPLKMLKPNTTYHLKAKVVAKSQEESKVKETSFTTVPMHQDRIWIEVVLEKNNHHLFVHKGDTILKKMLCSGGAENTPTPLGTFYTLEKGEQYFSHQTNEGANSYFKLSEGILIQGIPRNAYWELRQDILHQLGKGQTKGDIVLYEEDARWLYTQLPEDTMVIIHP